MPNSRPSRGAASAPGDQPPAAQAPDDQPSAPSTVPFDRAMVDAAWERQILNAPDQKVRARFGAGRVMSVQGSTVTVALPNDRVMQRCSPLRLQVQALLTTHLDSDVKLELVVNSAAAAQPEPPRTGGRPSPSSPPPGDDDAPHLDEDIGDVHQLDDAPDHNVDAVQRITDIFPGSKLVDTDQETSP